MDKNKKIIVIVLLVIACLIAIIPLFALKGAEFGGSDSGRTPGRGGKPAVLHSDRDRRRHHGLCHGTFRRAEEMDDKKRK